MNKNQVCQKKDLMKIVSNICIIKCERCAWLAWHSFSILGDIFDKKRYTQFTLYNKSIFGHHISKCRKILFRINMLLQKTAEF